MPFNTALSGIRAANQDLRVTGNNIANASTTGFKGSRAEFGDVYASSIGGGSSQVGSGVRVQAASQQFQQGNISFTDNTLDLAINGTGFFVTNSNGDQTYTRSGIFSLDNEGFVVNNINSRLQGFSTDANGNISSLTSDIQIDARNLQPQLTSEVVSDVNVDSRELPPQTAYTISAPRVTALDGAGDINVTITNPAGTPLAVQIATAGVDDADSIADALDSVTGVRAINNGGEVEVILDTGFKLTDNTSVAGAGALTDTPTTDVSIGFDANDSSTYNHSTALTIYDSLGNPHVMQQYFIKQPFDPANTSTTANHWKSVITVDGFNVGPATDANDPINTATVAVYDIFFTQNGAIDDGATPDIDITNWTPLDDSGDVIGAIGPGPLGGSDFEIFMGSSTQVSGDFEVRAANQNGTTTGRLSGLSIDESGFVFARYSNGQDRALAQVALADFSNPQGLSPSGDTGWAETFSSGVPLIGEPGTASLGLVQSGALEESNVDLSEQLVNLIIAQRNFQASAKTIETADATTQTIINLR